MALVPCRECGKQISSEALRCPQCGSPTAFLASALERRQPPPDPVVAPDQPEPFSRLGMPTTFLGRSDSPGLGCLWIFVIVAFVVGAVLTFGDFTQVQAKRGPLLLGLSIFLMVVFSILWPHRPKRGE